MLKLQRKNSVAGYRFREEIDFGPKRIMLFIYQGSEKVKDPFSEKEKDQHVRNDHQVKNSGIDATSKRRFIQFRTLFRHHFTLRAPLGEKIIPKENKNKNE